MSEVKGMQLAGTDSYDYDLTTLVNVNGAFKLVVVRTGLVLMLLEFIQNFVMSL